MMENESLQLAAPAPNCQKQLHEKGEKWMCGLH
jgi:hypothetical protein